MRTDQNSYRAQAGPLRTAASDVLLLGGTKSPAFLGTALDALQTVRPHQHRETLPRLGHQAAVDHPSKIATVLREFFQD